MCFFSWSYFSCKKLLFTPLILVSSILFSLIFLSSESNALTQDFYEKGTLSVAFHVCRLENYSNQAYYNCGNLIFANLESDFYLPDTDEIHYSLSLGSDTDYYNDFHNSWTNYDCDVNHRCYLEVERVLYSPKHDSDNYNYLSGGDFFYAQLSTTESFYFGSAKDFYMPASDYENLYLNYGGINSYLNFNLSDMVSCPDIVSDSYPCKMKYHAFTDPTLTESGINHVLLVSGQVPSDISTLYNIEFINNFYNSDTHTHAWSAWSGIDFLFPFLDNDTFELRVKFSKSDEYIDISGAEGFDPNDSLGYESDFMQNYLSDKLPELLEFNPNLPNPVNLIVGSFTDIECATFTTIPSWFGLSSQYICSPWKDNLRPILTPIFNFGMTMLLFGFAVSWLKKGDQV